MSKLSEKEMNFPAPKYTLYVDASDESKAAINAMKEAGLTFSVMYSNSRRVPAVDTGYGVYEGLNEIQGYIIPDPSWERKKAELDERFGMGSFTNRRVS